MKNNYSCLDGSMLEQFYAPVADEGVGANLYEDLSSGANGFTDAIFGTKEDRAERRKARQARRQARFETRMAAKTARNQAKLTTAEGLKEAAKDDGTAQAVASLGAPASASSSSTASKSNTMYYVIGGVVLLGAVAYFLMKGKGTSKN
jgi:hypothetical protein